jgi:hypothetical protein
VRYFVSTSSPPSDDHEVHASTCARLPNEDNRLFLGHFSTCEPAVAEARKLYRRSYGCAECAPDCHTS